jgi:hypothetical protein
MILGISWAELAARTAATQTVISRLEGDAVRPTLPCCVVLAGTLDFKITGTSAHAGLPEGVAGSSSSPTGAPSDGDQDH